MVAERARVDLIALEPFNRINRLRILLGATWCNCGCGLLYVMPYREISALTGLPLGTLNKLSGSVRVYVSDKHLKTLCQLTNLPAEQLLDVLDLHISPSAKKKT